MNIVELFQKGGPAMWPLLFLSILSLSTIIERIWFWTNLLTKEKQIVDQILDTARRDWTTAYEIAKKASDQPIGRFLYSPLRLHNPEPEIFRLALEAGADEEIAVMRRGDKILEAVIAISPLLGLLGTVLGLINSLESIKLGDIGTPAAKEVTLGISAALITTATGMIIAITTLAFYRTFQAFVFAQAKIFRKAGSELELLYRQYWPYLKSDSYYTENKLSKLPIVPESLPVEAPTNTPVIPPENGDTTSEDNRDFSDE